MKKNLYLILCLLGLMACQKDDEIPVFDCVVLDEVCTPHHTDADIQLRFETIGTDCHYELYYSTHKDMSNTHVITMQETGGVYTAHVEGLNDGCTYYYQYVVSGTYNKVILPDVKHFTTIAYNKPTVITLAPTTILSTGAICAGEVLSSEVPVTERGVEYGTSQNALTQHIQAKPYEIGAYTCYLANLQSGTTYYYRAYAKNVKGTSYGDVRSFKTLNP